MTGMETMLAIIRTRSITFSCTSCQKATEALKLNRNPRAKSNKNPRTHSKNVLANTQVLSDGYDFPPNLNIHFGKRFGPEDARFSWTMGMLLYEFHSRSGGDVLDPDGDYA
jgi:hypothetical protein